MIMAMTTTTTTMMVVVVVVVMMIVMMTTTTVMMMMMMMMVVVVTTTTTTTTTTTMVVVMMMMMTTPTTTVVVVVMMMMMAPMGPMRSSTTVRTCADGEVLDAGIRDDGFLLHHVRKGSQAGATDDADLGPTLRLSQNPVRNSLDLVVRTYFPVHNRHAVTILHPLRVGCLEVP